MTVSDDFDVTFLNPCLYEESATLTATAQQGPITDNFSNTQKTWTYSPFTVVPGLCSLTVSCKTITGPSDKLTCPNHELDPNGQVSFQFGETEYFNGYTPGTYTLTYEVTTGSPDAPLI